MLKFFYHLVGRDPFKRTKFDVVGCRFERRIAMASLIGDHFADGAALLAHCGSFGLEGVVSKRRDAPYVSGECKAWVKSKCDAWKKENRTVVPAMGNTEGASVGSIRLDDCVIVFRRFC